MNKSNSISPYYVGALLQGAIRQGHNAEDLVSSCGIAAELVGVRYVDADNIRVEPSKVSALIRKVWNLLDDEFMGFTDYRCKQGVFSIIAKQMIRDRTLGDALKNASYLYSTLRNDIELALEEKHTGVELSFNLDKPELDSEHFLVEFFLLIWHRFSSWLVAKRIPLKFVNLSYSVPDHVAEYSLLFPCHSRFGGNTNALVFHPDAMELPIKQGSKELAQFLINSPADLLSRPDFQRSFSTQVMNLIWNEGECRFRSLVELADYLNMSERNLRRRLSVEHTSYGDIKRSMREEKAIHLLVDKKLSVNEVGHLLGFVEVAAFSRAFRNWTGLSPRHYRDKYTV